LFIERNGGEMDKKTQFVICVQTLVLANSLSEEIVGAACCYPTTFLDDALQKFGSRVMDVAKEFVEKHPHLPKIELNTDEERESFWMNCVTQSLSQSKYRFADDVFSLADECLREFDKRFKENRVQNG
jgi:hypothetical protein